MKLHLVSITQLLEIQRCVKQEIKRRRKGSPDIEKQIKAFEDMYSDEVVCAPTNNLDGSPQGFPMGTLRATPQRKLRYFLPLVKQDWTHLFPNKDESRKYYVYAHVGIKNGYISLPKEYGAQLQMPFYIGKGTGNRAFDLKRNQGHGAKIRQLLKKGRTPEKIVHIIKDGLTESEALALESQLIYFFGTIYHHKAGVLVNLDLPEIPTFKTTMHLPPTSRSIADKAKRAAKKLVKNAVEVENQITTFL